MREDDDLLRRIEELERRVAQLETGREGAAADVQPDAALSAAGEDTAYFPPMRELLHTPYKEEAPPAPPTPVYQPPPARALPDHLSAPAKAAPVRSTLLERFAGVAKPPTREVSEEPRAPQSQSARDDAAAFGTSERWGEAAPAKKKHFEEGWEVRAATTWLPRIGGAMLLIGAAIGAAYVQPHMSASTRVLGAFAASALVGMAGFVARRKSEVYAHATWATALALAYFTSFASHFLEPMRIFTSMVPSLMLMALFATGLIVLAERLRSQPVAVIGLILGVIAALVSAQESQIYALFALGGLAAASGWLLVRHEWKSLTALALAATYASTAALWVMLPPPSSGGEVLAQLGALVFYHIVFTLAFWRWGRVWVARETALDLAPEHDAAPEMKVGLLPYSSSFAMLNSLAFIALSIRLLRVSGIYWSHAEYLLFALALGEAARLSVRALSRGQLWTFHLLTASALATAGIVAAFDGMVESAALAAESLLIVIAASRARQLRWLRPLALVPGALVLKELGGPITTTGGFIGGLLTCGLLLASTLPWECILVRRPQRFAERWLAVLEDISAQARALIATLMLFALLANWFDARPIIATAELFAAIFLAAGMILLRARAWTCGAALLALAAPFMMQIAYKNDVEQDLWQYIAIAFMALLLRLLSDRLDLMTHSWWKLLSGVLFAFPAAMVALYVGMRLYGASPWQGPLVAAVAAAFFAFERWPRTRLIPQLVPVPENEPGWSTRLPLRLPWPALRPGIIAAILLTGWAAVAAAIFDANTNLLSPLLLAGALLVGAIRVTTQSQQGTRAILAAMATAAGLCVALTGLGVYSKFHAWYVTAFLVPAMAVAVVMLRRGDRIQSTLFCGIIAVTPVLLVHAGMGRIATVPGMGAFTLIGAAAMLGATRLFRLAERVPVGDGKPSPFAAQAWLGVAWMTVCACGLAMHAWSSSGILSGQLITAAWAGTGVVVLVLGFIFLDGTLRGVALAVLAAAIGRTFLVELANADMLTKTIAFAATGVLLLVAGMGYVFWKTKLEGGKPAAPEKPREDGGDAQSDTEHDEQ